MRSRGYVDIGAPSWGRARPPTGSYGPDASRYVRTGEGDLIDICEVNSDDRYAQGPYTCLGHVDKWRSHSRIDVMSMNPRKLSAVLS